MILWFAGMSLVLMWVVFRDPAIDHRLVVAGALLPDVVDGVAGSLWVGHTLLFSVGLLFAIMVGTIGRRLLRRRLLAIPIGWFFHLILDPVWSHTSVFWWPAQGVSFGDIALPAYSRPLGLTVLLEVAVVVAMVWAFRRFGLADPARRAVFVRTGRIDRSLVEGEPPGC